MKPQEPAPRNFILGEWRAEPSLNELSCHDRRLRVEPKVMDVLLCLASQPGEVVSKETLIQTVWQDRFVTDEVITTTIWELRRALGDEAKNPRFIQTIPRKGYRLIAPIRTAEAIEEPATPTSPLTTSALNLSRFRWRMPAILVTAAFFLTLFGWQIFKGRSEFTKQHNSSHIQAIAVLPLKNFSGGPQQEALADAMTEALITDFARALPLRVVSRTSVMQYKATSKTAPQIARELNVDAIVEGSVQRSGDRVRVTIQLLDARRDQLLRAESYEREARDVLTLQSELSNVIAQELRASLALHEQARRSASTNLPAAAHEAYLQGRQHWNKRTEAGMRQALAQFERAVQRAPDYARAYSGLADTYLQFVNLDAMRPEEAFPNAKAAALKAVQLDDASAEAHTSLAMIRLSYEWDRAGAEAEFKRALALNPNYATARNWYSQFLWTAGRTDEALQEIKQAQQLEPDSIGIQITAGTLYSLRDQHDEAIACFRRVLDLDPNYEVAWKSLAKVYDRKAMPREADAAFQKFRALTDTPSATQMKQRFVSWSRRDDPKYLLHKLSLFWKRKYVRASYIARLYADVGDKERALEWLEKAFTERDSDLLLLDTDRSWDRLRDDPRFVALAHRVGANS
jgi:TolB-like protein/DNA-binding winged helix-turn-helix (wHTH) protein